MDFDAAILYKLNNRVNMISVGARSTASLLRVLEDKLKLTIFGIKTRTFESVFINNEKMLYFFATKNKQHNDIVVREGIYTFNLVFHFDTSNVSASSVSFILYMYNISYIVSKVVCPVSLFLLSAPDGYIDSRLAFCSHFVKPLVKIHN